MEIYVVILKMMNVVFVAEKVHNMNAGMVPMFAMYLTV
jgi:hypothetical protein